MRWQRHHEPMYDGQTTRGRVLVQFGPMGMVVVEEEERKKIG